MTMDKMIIEDINKCIDSEKDEMLAMLKKYIQFRSLNSEMLEEGQKSEIKDYHEKIWQSIFN